MSRIRLIGLALVAVFAFSAVTVASASAAPVWEQQIGGTFGPITTPVTAASKSIGNLTLTDSVAGTSIECAGTDSGKVGAGSKDEVTSITASSCKFVTAGSCTSSKPVTATAKNLPWITELYEEAGKVRDHVKAHSGGGEPGYDVECTVAGIFKVQDECLGETNTAMNNVTGGVEAVFDATSPKVKCSIGGAGSGTVLGKDLNENPASGAIRVS
jgi:hypothetical protein